MDPAERDVEQSEAVRPARGQAAVAAPTQTPLQDFASSIGNRGFTEMVSRMREGDGLMDGGVVHPGIETAIGAARGGGRPLDADLSSQFEPSLGGLDDVRVHTGGVAADLARAVSARAFTVGTDIFFGHNEYRPGSAGGNELIAHEVAHAVQQRGAPAAGPLTASMPGDALEVEAETMARDLTA